MFRTTLTLLLLLLAVPTLAAPAAAAEVLTAPHSCSCQRCRNGACATRGDWFVAETPNFSVWTRDSKHRAVETAHACEELRTNLKTDWKLTNDVPWQPKCAVVIHPEIDEYRRELGSQDRSVGCTTITSDEGRIVFRRIDLRADADDWRSNALPHELTHVVLADRFGDRPLPHWLNEGLAMLAENDELRERRESILAAAHRRGDIPSLQSVLSASTKSPHRDADVSYAVSASLVRQLEQQLGRDTLLDFAEQLSLQGAATPTADTLALVGDLQTWERRWHDSIARIEPAPLDVP